MNNNVKIKEFWEEFCARNPDVPANEPFQTWHFGNSPEMAAELAALVLSVEKMATASLAEVNKLKPEEAPVADGYSVVTDFSGNPLCVIRTVEIRHLPFNKVDSRFAFDEGEGDRSLEYWRRVHREYFEREAAELGIEFDEDSIVCCERFELRYVK